MEIRLSSAVLAAPRIGRIPETESAQPVKTQAPADVAAQVARPGSVEASREAPPAPVEARYVRDDETNRLVLSVVDPGTGDVIAQLPTKAALRAQAYATEIAARAAPRPSLGRLA